MNQAKAPLDDVEIRQAATILRRDGGLDESAWFETISLDGSGELGAGRGA